MRKEDKIKAAIVGCGVISDIYMANLSEGGRFNVIDLVACCDLRESAAKEKAEKYGLEVMTFEEICSNPEIQIVINLTTPGAHYSVIKQLLLAGKNVYTEKVLAIHLHEAEELGCLSIIAKMKKGKAFYKMAVSGNIYDENGHIVLFNLNPKLLPMMNKT